MRTVQSGAENGLGSTTSTIFEISVSPTNTTGVAVTGTYSLSGTATNGVDYTGGGLTYSIANSATSTLVNLVTQEDILIEGTETVIFTLLTVSTGTIATVSTSATISDDDAGDFSVSTSSLSMNENTTTSMTVVLDSQPTSDVVLSITSNNTTDVTVSPSTVTFTTSTWNVAQPIVLTAVDDAVFPDASATLTIAVVDASSDDAFDAAADQTVAVSVADDDDVDDDGNADAIEDAGFNGGDGNGDGIIDSIQQFVSASPNPVTGAYTTLAATGTCAFIVQNSFVDEASLSVLDSSANYPVGLVDFQLQCPSAGDSATVTLYYTQVYDTSSWSYKKYDSSGNVYSDITSLVTFSTATVGGTPVTTVTFTLTDGDAQTDEDGIADNVINDPSGPAVAVVASTPASSGSSGHFIPTAPYIDKDSPYKLTEADADGKVWMSGAFVINNDDAVTDTRSVRLQFRDIRNAWYMAFSDTTDFSGKSFVNYTEEAAYTLPKGEGTKTVYALLRSKDGATLMLKDTIRLVPEDVEEIVVPTTVIPIPENGLGCSESIYLKNPVHPVRQSTNNPDDVRLLEKYLNTYEGHDLPVDGMYSATDIAAVVAWQEKYESEILTPWGITEGTGYVYITSLAKIKSIHDKNCATATASSAGSTPLVACLTTNTTLVSGVTNSEIAKAQLILKYLGYFPADIDATGYYGPITKKSVIAYQAANSIDTLGIIGPATRASLNTHGCAS